MRFISSLFDLGAALALSSVLPISHCYQRMRPVTDKNIGRNRLKSRSRYMPHQGKRECARRLRQWAKIEARRAGR